MWRARTTQRPCPRRHAPARWWILVTATCGLLLASSPGSPRAQDLSIISPSTTKPPSAFPKTKGGLIGPLKKIDPSLPLYLQGDELIYDTKGNRVTARGNIEIYYNNYILTADEVTYDQNANTVMAAGNVTLKEPNGLITRGERITL